MLDMFSLATLVTAAIVFGLASVRYGTDSRRDERNW